MIHAGVILERNGKSVIIRSYRINMSFEKKFLITGLIALAILLGVFFLFIGKKDQKEEVEVTTGKEETVVNELKIEDLVVGTGAEAVTGKNVTVNYKGTLENGTQFDSSYDRGVPFSFALGAGEVIAGWDQGVAGMKVGGKRVLTIPPDLGYGSRAVGTIPPNSVLIFEVELLKVE
jgi:FKBP-type peptidyl-prolyl cis-trans isomerase